MEIILMIVFWCVSGVVSAVLGLRPETYKDLFQVSIIGIIFGPANFVILLCMIGGIYSFSVDQR